MIKTFRELIEEDYLCPFCKVKLVVQPAQIKKCFNCPRSFDFMGGKIELDDSIYFRLLGAQQDTTTDITIFQDGETWISIYYGSRNEYKLSYDRFDIDYIEQKIKTILAFA